MSVSPRQLRSGVGASVLVTAVLLVGCYPWVGPLRVTLETGGQTYDDVVVYPFLGLADLGLHSTSMVEHEPRIASSEQTFSLGPWFRSPRFNGVLLEIYHPHFHHVWHRDEDLTGGPVELRLELEPWERAADQDPPPGIGSVLQHLGLLQSRYVPALTEERREAFRRYLPELRALAERARYFDDAGKVLWDKGEDDARSLAEELLAELDRVTG